MKLLWCRLALLACCASALAPVVAPVVAPADASDTVRRVHELELAGQNVERTSALAGLKQVAPDAAQTHWLSGEVRVGDQWVPYTKVADHGDRWSELYKYREERAKRTDSEEDQYFLADGCRQHKLVDEERAHLFGVVTHSPADEEARQRLGDVNVDGVWVTTAQAAQAERQIRENQAAFQKWGKLLQQTKVNLDGKWNKRRVAAQETLDQLRDYSAIPVMEELFATGTEPDQLIFKTWVCRLNSWKASAALARLALLTDSARVRLECISELKKRRLEEYVPTVLATMVSPIEVEGATMRFGIWALYGQRSVVETADKKYVFHYTARFGPEIDYLSNGRGMVRINRADRFLNYPKMGERFLSSFEQSEFTTASSQNASIQVWNDRCTSILSESTGRSGLDSARDWWAWWNDDQGYFDMEKEQVFAQYQEDWFISRRRPRLQRNQAVQLSVAVTRSGSCFAADTPVQSEYGHKPISSIVRGDRVLSQNVETGELTYKSVLRTANRVSPGSAIVSCGEDKLHCTPGHPFWVNGLGWRMADELEPGMRFHSLDGAVEVKAVESSENLDVYNLEVADFNTYFVGQSQVLTHDVTVRQPTDMLLPGLAKTEVVAP